MYKCSTNIGMVSRGGASTLTSALRTPTFTTALPIETSITIRLELTNVPTAIAVLQVPELPRTIQSIATRIKANPCGAAFSVVTSFATSDVPIRTTRAEA